MSLPTSQNKSASTCPGNMAGERNCTLQAGHKGPCDFYGYTDESEDDGDPTPWCTACGARKHDVDAELVRLRAIENAAMRVASSRRGGVVLDKAALDRLDQALEGRS